MAWNGISLKGCERARHAIHACYQGQGLRKGSFSLPPFHEHRCHSRRRGTQNATGKRKQKWQNKDCSTQYKIGNHMC